MKSPGIALIVSLLPRQVELERLRGRGIDLDKLTRQLEDEGVEKFNRTLDKLIKILGARVTRGVCGRTLQSPRPGWPRARLQ